MALRTISATGGNWNAATTWLEGVVPTSVDDVIGNSASGNLTINTNATIQSLQLDGGGIGDYWAGILNISSGFTLQPQGNATLGTCSFSPNMGMTGLGTLNINTQGRHRFYGFTLSTTTNWNNSKILVDDLNWQIPSGVTSRFFTFGQSNNQRTPTGTSSNVYLWFNENQALYPAYLNGLATNGGSVSVYLKSHNGTVWGNAAGNTGIAFQSESSNTNGLVGSGIFIDGGTGTYSIRSYTMAARSYLEWISGALTGPLYAIIYSNFSSGQSHVLNMPLRWNAFYFGSNQIGGSGTWTNTLSNKYELLSATDIFFGEFTNNSSNVIRTWKLNTGLSASTLNVLNNVSLSGNVSPFYNLAGTALEFSSSFTYSFDKISAISMPTSATSSTAGVNRVALRSWTASVPATIKINNAGTFSTFANSDFTDINFTGTTLYAINNSTITRSTGITSSLSGGGSSIVGGSFTFVS